MVRMRLVCSGGLLFVAFVKAQQFSTQLCRCELRKEGVYPLPPGENGYVIINGITVVPFGDDLCLRPSTNNVFNPQLRGVPEFPDGESISGHQGGRRLQQRDKFKVGTRALKMSKARKSGRNNRRKQPGRKRGPSSMWRRPTRRPSGWGGGGAGSPQSPQRPHRGIFVCPRRQPPVNPGPDVSQAFENAIIPGFQEDSGAFTEEVDGEMFEITYSGRVAEQGVVALAVAADVIKTVTCSYSSNEGIIEITFLGDISPSQLEDLFPIGFLLAVDSAVFGPCDLGLLDGLEGEAAQNRLSVTDGFLQMTSTSVSGRTVRLTGSPSNYFFMFERGNISVRRLGEDSPEGPGGSRRLIRRTVSAEASKEFNLHPLVTARAEAGINVTGFVETCEADWSIFSGIDLELKMGYSATARAELALEIDPGPITLTRMSDLISIGIGTEAFPVFSALGLPEFKLGVFYEFPAQFEIEAGLNTRLGATAVLEVMGRTEATFRMSGGWFSLEPSFEVTTHEPLRFTMSTISPDPSEDTGETSIELLLGAFAGFRPQFALYFGSVGDIKAGGRYGVDVDGVLRLPPPAGPYAPFDPVPPPPNLLPVLFGECSTCHFAEIDMALIDEPPVLTIMFHFKSSFFGIDEKIDETFPFPNNPPTVKLELAKLCLLESETLSCGQTCCQTCDQWVQFERLRDQSWISLVSSELPCDCNASDAEANSRLERSDVGIEDFHPGADTCYRGTISTPAENYGQQCCYSNGIEGIQPCTSSNPCSLITSGPGAGSLDIVSPSGLLDTGRHFFEDVVPFYLCGEASGWRQYSQVRPTDNGLSCPETGTDDVDPPATPIWWPGPQNEPEGPGYLAGVVTDPHLFTFNGLEFDCQADGEFTLSKSLDSIFEVQGRFAAVGPSNGAASITTAMVFRDENLPTIEVSVPSSAADSSTLIGGCPVDLVVDGVRRNIVDGTGVQGVDVTVTGFSISVSYASSGVQWRVRVLRICSRCGFTFNLFLPLDYRSEERIVGLLGTPNDSDADDWTDASGQPLQIEGRYFEPSYNYCTSNWCVRDPSDSLFTYEEGFQHSDFFNCDAPYGSEFDLEFVLNGASEEVRRLCDNNVQCLIDGFLCGLSAAQDALDDQTDLAGFRAAASAPAAPSAPSASPTFSASAASQLRTCVAVIDESSIADSEIERLWTEFRTTFPDRPFCLLQPLPEQRFFLPTAFSSDPLTTFANVNRDVGDAALASDWFDLCGIESIPPGIQSVALFVDDSGSLNVVEVQASIDLFRERLSNANLGIISREDTRENWIAPFLAELV